MLLFAHTGITLGVALAGAQLLPPAGSPALTDPGLNRLNSFLLSSLQRLSHTADIRFLLLGSLLPDVIDKPLCMWLLKDSIGAGRAFSHSLLFLLIVAVAGRIVQRRWKSNWLLVIGFGVLVHLVLDSMWRAPQTLFWPVFGVHFPKDQMGFLPWITGMLNGLFANPTELIVELLGFLLLLWCGYAIWRSGKMKRFLRTGRVT